MSMVMEVSGTFDRNILSLAALPLDANKDEIFKIFSNYGRVVKCLAEGSEGSIEYETGEEADSAIAHLTGSCFMDETLWDLSKFVFFPDADNEHVSKDGREYSADVLLIVNCALPATLKYAWNLAKLRICADGGTNRLYDHFPDREKWIPDYIKGDLDSVKHDVRDYYEKHGAISIKDGNQDNTDLTKCLHLIWEQEAYRHTKYSTILVAGGLGGSFTHEAANFNTLFENSTRHIVLWSEYNVCWLLRAGGHRILCKSGMKCGILPLGWKSVVTTTGLQWNLNGSTLEFGGLISTSNKTVSDYVRIHTSRPVIFSVDFYN